MAITTSGKHCKDFESQLEGWKPQWVKNTCYPSMKTWVWIPHSHEKPTAHAYNPNVADIGESLGFSDLQTSSRFNERPCLNKIRYKWHPMSSSASRHTDTMCVHHSLVYIQHTCVHTSHIDVHAHTHTQRDIHRARAYTLKIVLHDLSDQNINVHKNAFPWP